MAGYTVEREWHAVNGDTHYLLRKPGGQHVHLFVTAENARGDRLPAIVDDVLAQFPPPPGPNTRAGVDE